MNSMDRKARYKKVDEIITKKKVINSKKAVMIGGVAQETRTADDVISDMRGK